MNNKLRKIIIIFLTFFLIIFILNITTKGLKSNKSDITNINILDYIPSDYELTIISNSTNNDIKKFIKEKTSQNKKEKLNIIKDGIISYLGFDLQDKFENIYDNEFAITFIKNKLNKNDILLVFKIKEGKNINNIINIRKELNNSDKIIELKRPDKLNYISHIFQTTDNYIIAASSKNLIDSSLQSKKNGKAILSKDLIPDDLNLRETKLLSISKNFFQLIDSKSESMNKLITIINSENDQIMLKSFSSNIKNTNDEILHNRIDNIRYIISTNNNSYNQKNINLLYKNINQKAIIEEMIQKINDKIVLALNNNSWVFCFNSRLHHKGSIDELDYLKNHKKEDFYINNITYSIYTNDRLKMKDNNIIYEKEEPIFSLKDGENIFVSNNLDYLQNITQETSIYDQYINNYNDIKSFKYIVNDIIFIKFINDKQLSKYYKSLRNLQYFLNTELFSLEDINIHIRHIIPEKYETMYLESNLKIF